MHFRPHIPTRHSPSAKGGTSDHLEYPRRTHRECPNIHSVSIFIAQNRSSAAIGRLATKCHESTERHRAFASGKLLIKLLSQGFHSAVEQACDRSG